MHPQTLKLACLGLVASVGSASASASGLYSTVMIGNAAVDETGRFGDRNLAFPGPVDHDICGSQAVITVGAQPFVTRLRDHATDLRFGIGWRGDGDLAWEFGYFNIARFASHASAGPYSVVQPSCADWTVSAEGLKIEQLRISGFTFGPVYAVPLDDAWSVELRAMVNFYETAPASQWQVVVTEYNMGDPVRTYPTAAQSSESSHQGVDGGFGIGIAWRMSDTVRLRASLERQKLGGLDVDSALAGVAIDF